MLRISYFSPTLKALGTFLGFKKTKVWGLVEWRGMVNTNSALFLLTSTFSVISKKSPIIGMIKFFCQYFSHWLINVTQLLLLLTLKMSLTLFQCCFFFTLSKQMLIKLLFNERIVFMKSLLNSCSEPANTILAKF